MSQVVFEPTIPVFYRAKIVGALDRAAIVIGFEEICSMELVLWTKYIK
jgi:hypothetical protein